MPVTISSSTAAIVRFTGLGILCHNEEMSRAENLFIHEGKHAPIVEIFSPLYSPENDHYNANSAEAEGDPTLKNIFDHNSGTSHWWYRREALHEISHTHLNSGLTIEIVGENDGSSLPDTTFFKKPGSPDNFDHSPTAPNDPDDYRWLVNAAKDGFMGPDPDPLVAPANCNLNRDHGFLTSTLFISHAEIYTETLAKDAAGVNLVYNKVQEGSATFTPYGWIADEMGAHIDTASVRLNITAGKYEIIHSLPRLHKPHVIFIKNNAAISESDMPIYRNFWNIEDSVATYDLKTDSELMEVDYVTGRELCSGIFTDCQYATAESFRPLPS